MGLLLGVVPLQAEHLHAHQRVCEEERQRSRLARLLADHGHGVQVLELLRQDVVNISDTVCRVSDRDLVEEMTCDLDIDCLSLNQR